MKTRLQKEMVRVWMFPVACFQTQAVGVLFGVFVWVELQTFPIRGIYSARLRS